MTRLLLFVGAALAVDCGLPDAIDPAPETCFESDLGWANMNVDREVDGTRVSAVSLEIDVVDSARIIELCKSTNMDSLEGTVPDPCDTVTEYTDADSGKHTAHPGTISTTELASNGRYLLTCADFGTSKNLELTVTRPAANGKFQSEAVFAYAKGKWDVLQDEVEARTHNGYGSEVPLWNTRAGFDGSDLMVDTRLEPAPSINFQMSLPYTGDYEFKYATPTLMNDCPTSGCYESEDGSGGKWIALEFKSTLLRVGSPWADCTAGGTDDYSGVSSLIPVYYGHPNIDKTKYDDIAAVIAAHTTHPITVVLQIYTPTSGNILYDADDNPTYRSNDLKWTIGGVDAPDTPMSDATDIAAAAPYTKCYRAGTPCPDNNSVCGVEFCNIQMWRDIVKKLKPDGVTNVKVVSYIETMTTTLDDEGKLIPREKGDIEADIASTKTAIPDINGFYFGSVDGSDPDADVLAVSRAENAAFETIIELGSPLLDASAIEDSGGAADVFVTTNGALEDLGAWSPYAFYPTESPTRWAALVTDVPADKIADTPTGEPGLASKLYDRGYGIVHMHSASDFSVEPADLQTVLDRVTAQKTGGRRLTEARRLQTNTPTYSWSCDDTLFKCGPVCLKTHGVSTVEVPDTECAGQPLDPCACDCLYDARWACADGAVICQAKDTHSMKHRKVADLVCEMRGTEKPEFDSFTMRTADECVEVPTARGNVPTQECRDQYTAAKDEALRQQAAATSTAAPTPVPTTSTTPEPDPVVEDEPTVTTQEDTTQEDTTQEDTTQGQAGSEDETEEAATTTARPTAGGLNVDMVIWSFATPAALAALIALLA
jgi:hypothetical protein